MFNDIPTAHDEPHEQIIEGAAGLIRRMFAHDSNCNSNERYLYNALPPDFYTTKDDYGELALPEDVKTRLMREDVTKAYTALNNKRGSQDIFVASRKNWVQGNEKRVRPTVTIQTAHPRVQERCEPEIVIGPNLDAGSKYNTTLNPHFDHLTIKNNGKIVLKSRGTVVEESPELLADAFAIIQEAQSTM